MTTLPYQAVLPTRPLSCVAGFFPHECSVQEAAQALRRHHGIGPAQMVLMSPRDAEPAKFAKLASRWAGRWSASGQSGLGFPGALAGLAGLASVLALTIVASHWLVEADLPLGATVLGTILALLGAGLVAGWLVMQWPAQPRQRRFESSVQRQLSGGCWALVVHELPRGRQDGVVSLLRGSSLRWCAVALPKQRL